MDTCVRHLLIEGRVQGVGFRWALRNEARALGLRGWVRNRHDGRVEAVIAGSPEAVGHLTLWARHGPSTARVDRVLQNDHASFVEGLPCGFEERPSA